VLTTDVYFRYKVQCYNKIITKNIAMTQQYQTYPIDNPFLAYIGAKCVYANTTGSELHLTIQPHLTNSFGSAHGGLLTTLMDTAMSWAARLHDAEPKTVLTLEIKSSFFNAVFIGDNITCKAKILHKTTTLTFCEAEIYILSADIATNSNPNPISSNPNINKLVCKASASFKLFKHRGKNLI
jgi:uncharacterized protein (TIGR00369 family)